MWYAVVINTDAEKAFRYLLYTRAGSFWPSREYFPTCSAQNHLLAESEGEGNLPVLCREGDEHRLRGTEESHRREP